MAQGLPVDQVKSMQAQGMDNNQIIQALQRDGYNATQIFDAMNQAAVAGHTPAVHRGEHSMNDQQYPPQSPQQSTPPHPPGASGSAPGTSSGSSGPVNQEGVEELVEAIIDEKWNELVKDINTIVEWKNQAQNTIVSIEQQFNDLKAQFDKLHQALIAKIGEYDKNILDVGAEVKAMEKVFSKVLPVFTENVSELNKITKRLKDGESGGGREEQEGQQE
ncbi:hypothetical protein KY327_00555 [Candidatus Woesearchaeota archaeon]|nr:hypothetical protein [Candidatus Woesearchaeota archaeon]